MKVNFAATHQRFRDTGRKVGLWATTKKLSRSNFINFMNGRYVPVPGGKAETLYLAKMREDDLLVLEEEPEEQAEGDAESETQRKAKGAIP